VASETIKEFAVRLGFNIDDASERKFTGSLVGAVASANLLASALEKMAGVVATRRRSDRREARSGRERIS
jgi:hypothetical protein